MDKLKKLVNKYDIKDNYTSIVLKFLKNDLSNDFDFSDYIKDMKEIERDITKDSIRQKSIRKKISEIDLEKEIEEFKKIRETIDVNKIENKKDLLDLYEKVRYNKFFDLLNVYHAYNFIQAFFRTSLTTFVEFPDFLEQVDYYELNESRLEEWEESKEKFYNKFKDFSYVNYDNWDSMDKEESFINYLENNTKFTGSGKLGTNKNKLFYYVKDKENEKYGEYCINNNVKNMYPEKSNKETFDIFYKECLGLITTDVDSLKNFNFNILKNNKVISSKLYNLYSKTPTLCINSHNFSQEISKYFPEVDYSDIPLVYSRNMEKYLYENYPELKGLDKNVITDILWKYKSMLSEKTSKKSDNIEKEPVKKLFKSHNIIYAGAPGTGKSHMIDEKLSDIDEFVTRVTFYPDYEYHDFVGSILPKVDDKGNVKYKFSPGTFTSILKRAIDKPNDNHYLVIEEMSRGNCASIFGDIFQLLDRDEEGNSKYGINNELIAKELDIKGKVKLPSNLYILGTVNTSDQNVFVMDTAFKRRFDFKYLSVEDKQEEIGDIKFLDVYWKDFYLKLNEFIIDNLNISEDKQLGPFFINKEEQNTKVIMYLYEDIIGTYRNNKDLFNDNIKTLTNALRVTTIKELFSEEFIEFYRDTNED